MKDNGLLIFDADDTLWESGLYFRRAAEDFVSLLVGLGLDRDEMAALVHRRDIERLGQTGYGAEPYIGTLEHVLAEACPTPPAFAGRALADIATALLDHPVLPLPGVVATLDELRRRGRRMVVWTMGQQGHQGDKLRRSGLTDHFERAFIVARKSPQSLADALLEMGATAANATVIGNSPRSDINPALEAGIRAVWIPDHEPWEAERQPFVRPEGVTRLTAFGELLEVL